MLLDYDYYSWLSLYSDVSLRVIYIYKYIYALGFGSHVKLAGNAESFKLLQIFHIASCCIIFYCYFFTIPTR